MVSEVFLAPQNIAVVWTMVKEHFNVLCWKHCWVKHCPSAIGAEAEQSSPGWGGGWCAEGMCGREVLLLQGLDQVGAVLRVNAPQRTFPTGLRGESAELGFTVNREHISSKCVTKPVFFLFLFFLNYTEKLIMHLNIAFLNTTFFLSFRQCLVLFIIK